MATRVAEFGWVKLVFTGVAVTGDAASVSFSVLLNGKPAFVDLTGSLNRHGDRWMVTHRHVPHQRDRTVRVRPARASLLKPNCPTMSS